MWPADRIWHGSDVRQAAQLPVGELKQPGDIVVFEFTAIENHLDTRTACFNETCKSGHPKFKPYINEIASGTCAGAP